MQAPFRTIWRALNVSRTLGRIPRAILLNAGRYVLNETISLSEVPSYAAPLGRLRFTCLQGCKQEDSNLTISGHNGAVVLTGGVPLDLQVSPTLHCAFPRRAAPRRTSPRRALPRRAMPCDTGGGAATG